MVRRARALIKGFESSMSCGTLQNQEMAGSKKDKRGIPSQAQGELSRRSLVSSERS